MQNKRYRQGDTRGHGVRHDDDGFDSLSDGGRPWKIPLAGHTSYLISTAIFFDMPGWNFFSSRRIRLFGHHQHIAPTSTFLQSVLSDGFNCRMLKFLSALQHVPIVHHSCYLSYLSVHSCFRNILYNYSASVPCPPLLMTHINVS